MIQIKIVIAGDPLPAARPRFSGRRAYQPARNRDYREVVKAAAVAAMDGHEPLKCPIGAKVKLYRRFKPKVRQFGDVDNHLKAIFDGLNGICFDDDAQVVSVLAEKHRDKNNPRTEIELTPAACDD